VKLQRRLRKLQRIDENREIDRTFISCAEYQLFLDEMRANDKFYQPDHWTTFHFPKGSALQPIAGVRAQDAEKFCEWLSEEENKKYRCPALAEAQEFCAIENHGVATWCDKNCLQWSSSITKQQIESKQENLLKGSGAVKYFQRDKFVLARSLARSVNLDLIIDRALDRALLDLTIDRALDLARALDTDLYHDSALHLDDDILTKFLENQDFPAAQHQLQQLQPTNAVEQRRMNLLTELFNILTTENVVEQRQAWYRYIGYLAEYAVIIYEILEPLERSRQEGYKNALRLRLRERSRQEKYENTWWLDHPLFMKINYTEKKEIMAALCAWTKIVEARLKGELPAWEGIRIVRERDI